MPQAHHPADPANIVLDEVAQSSEAAPETFFTLVHRTTHDSQSIAWLKILIHPDSVHALAERLKVTPEFTRHAQELHINIGTGYNTWITDPWPPGFGSCLRQDWSNLQVLAIGFFNWKSLSDRDQSSLHALTQLPTLLVLRAACVTDMPFSVFTKGFRHIFLTNCSLERDINLQSQSLPHAAPRYYLNALVFGEISPRESAMFLNDYAGYARRGAAWPTALTNLRFLSFASPPFTIARPGLARVLAMCSASLEVLKIRAGETLAHPDRTQRVSNAGIDLSRMTALRSLMIQCLSLENDFLDFVFSTLMTIGPRTPLRDITIRTAYHPSTRPIPMSLAWVSLDVILGRLRSLPSINIGIVPASYCGCDSPRCIQCAQELDYQESIYNLLPNYKSRGVLSIKWLRDNATTEGNRDFWLGWLGNMGADPFLAHFPD